MPKISTKAFADALTQIAKPKGKQLQFLRNHLNSPAKATTAAVLAHSVGYKNWRPVNLHYGKLAAKIGARLGVADPGLSVLLDFAGPKTVSNENWILVMKPEFADALVQAGWVE
jgi:hypothetical protein